MLSILVRLDILKRMEISGDILNIQVSTTSIFDARQPPPHSPAVS
jgi:hypothetical protein